MSVLNNPELLSGHSLPLMELFYSIQGEGYNTGEAACFIRIGGCDVGCKWCDVKESWNPDIHPLTNTDEIIQQVLEYPAKSVVVTGGEPLMYNMSYLCNCLKQHGIRTFLETSGSYALTGVWDWICVSPKQKQQPLKEVCAVAHELKVIVSDASDITWAEENALLVNNACRLFLQPEWSKRKDVTPMIVDYVMQNPTWKISLQTHKYLNIP